MCRGLAVLEYNEKKNYAGDKEEVFDMQMTEEEICKRFERNGCYKEHIAILAQLNAVDACVIEKILHKNKLYDNRRTIRNRERTNK